MRSALLSPALITLTALAFAVLTACGGSGGEEPEAAPSKAPTYSLDDRASFLAAGPDCEELTGWYAQFPADTDPETAVALVAACGTLPKAFLDDPDRVSVSPLLLETLLDDSGVTVDPTARTVALQLLAHSACDSFDADSKSLWQLQNDIIDVGGSAKDYPPVVKLAQARCPEHKDDLGMFDTPNPMAAATKLRRFIEGSYTVPPAGDSEYAGLAGVTCSYLRRGESLASASMLLEYLPTQSGQGEKIGRRAAELFCPSQL